MNPGGLTRSDVVAGTGFAVLAALAFGVTTPLIQRWGAGLGPFTTAALLYLGAAACPGGRWASPLGTADRWRIVLMAVLGAALAPTLFAWGLQRVPPTAGALLLNAEAAFTVLLAAVAYRERIGWRLRLAVALMTLGGVVSVGALGSRGAVELKGALVILAAVLCWALDNVLSRPLAHGDVAQVVRWKASLGAALTAAVALARSEPPPHLWPALGLMACGVVGYGASLRLYLMSQRRVGAGRAGSAFAVAPFIGALTAIALGDRPTLMTTAASALLFAAGLALHLTEPAPR